MGRRFICLIVVALTVGFGGRMAYAQADAPASAPPVEPLPAPGEVPPPGELPAGVDFSAPPLPMSDPVEPPATPTEPSGAQKQKSGDLPAPVSEPTAPEVGKPTAGATVPAEMSAPPAVDAEVERSQAPQVASSKGANGLAETNPLPAAKQPAGGAASLAPNEADELVLSSDRLRPGAQALGLSIEVKGPPTLNLMSPATYKILVTNNGAADAMGVVVRDALPPELEFISSQPAEQRGPETLLVWNLGTVRAGTQQVISLKVKPTKIGLFDHAATVSMRSGAKTSTHVYEPKLKVVQLISSPKVLKWQTVESRITVSNTGNGVAKNVLVRAKLSPGLRADGGESSEQNIFELDLGDLAPGQQVSLEPLVAEAIMGDEQWCKVDVTSPDVVPGAEEASSTQTVTVTEPKLVLALSGPKTRFTDTIASYSLTVENPGSAPARNVRVQTILPINGQLVKLPVGARFDSNTRRISWDPFLLEAGDKGKAKLSFEVRMGGAGLYPITALAAGEQGLNAKEMISTDVLARADLDLQVTEDRRVVDVNQKTTYFIKVQNKGSKEALNILIWGKHSENLKVTRTAGTEQDAQYKQEAPGKPGTEFVFPQIPRLNKGQTIELAIEVQALKPGIASCRIFLTHDDIDPIDDVATFTVTPTH